MVTKFDRLLLIFKTASTWRKRHGGWYRNLVGSLQRVRHSLYNKHADAFSSSFCEAKRADSVSLRLHWHNKSIIRLSYLHKWATTNFECRPHGSGHNRDNTETQSFQQHRCYGFGKIRDPWNEVAFQRKWCHCFRDKNTGVFAHSQWWAFVCAYRSVSEGQYKIGLRTADCGLRTADCQ